MKGLKVVEIRFQKNTVCISLPEEGEKRYVKADMAEIYQKIHAGEALRLSGVAIEGLSVAAYREHYHIPAEEIVEVQIDVVTNCLFFGDGDVILDFSNCCLKSPDLIAGICLEENIFYKGKICFSSANIIECDLSMTGSKFWEAELYFDFTKFGDNDLCLNDTNFYDTKSAVHFIGTDFGARGELQFSYMSGLSGMMEFYRCELGENTMDFAYMNCPKCQFIFWDLETPSVPIDFVDSFVRMIILYKVNINGLLDFRILSAEDIIIQESVIRDCVLLGNQGYKNYTSYCFKKSTLLGRIKIQNKFSKKLFRYQKQMVCDIRTRDKEISLCQTSSTDKANQLMILAENYHSEGEADNEDKAYVLSKRYRSRGRVRDIWTDYAAVGRTEGYKESFIKRFGAYLEITVKLIGAAVAWLFEKIFLDVLCGNYATRPSKFLAWIIAIVTGFAFIYGAMIGIDSGHFQLADTVYQNINSEVTAWIYSLQTFLQIDNGDLIPKVADVYYLMVGEKIIGLMMFSIFVVSYTRKVIK